MPLEDLMLQGYIQQVKVKLKELEARIVSIETKLEERVKVGDGV